MLIYGKKKVLRAVEYGNNAVLLPLINDQIPQWAVYINMCKVAVEEKARIKHVSYEVKSLAEGLLNLEK